MLTLILTGVHSYRTEYVHQNLLYSEIFFEIDKKTKQNKTSMRNSLIIMQSRPLPGAQAPPSLTPTPFISISLNHTSRGPGPHPSHLSLPPATEITWPVTAFSLCHSCAGDLRHLLPRPPAKPCSLACLSLTLHDTVLSVMFILLICLLDCGRPISVTRESQ